MVYNIGSSSGAQSSYYSEANERGSTRSSTAASRRSLRSSSGQFGPLAARQDTVSEFGSVASQGALDYHAYHGNPYFDLNSYSQWRDATRAPSGASENTEASFVSADDRPFDGSQRARSDISVTLSEAGSRCSDPIPSSSSGGSSTVSSLHPLSDAGSRCSDPIPSSSSGGSSTVSSLHPLSDVGQTLSEAGSRHSATGHLSSHTSDARWTRHQNRLPSVSDGSYQQSLTGSELGAISAARRGGRLNSDRGSAFSRGSDLGSVARSLDDSERAAVTRAIGAGRFGFRGGAPESQGSDSPLHSIAENLSTAGSRSSSAEREQLIERLNALRDFEGSIPANAPGLTYMADPELSVSDITLSTAVTEAGPPSRRPPRPPSRLRNVTFAESEASSGAASSYQPPVAPTRRGAAIYGRQPALSRVFNSLNPRRWG